MAGQVWWFNDVRNYSIGFRSFATSKTHPVDSTTSWTPTPSAISDKISPRSLSTVKTPSSVMMRSTQALPVRGRVQLSKILCFPPCKKRDRNWKQFRAPKAEVIQENLSSKDDNINTEAFSIAADTCTGLPRSAAKPDNRHKSLSFSLNLQFPPYLSMLLSAPPTPRLPPPTMRFSGEICVTIQLYL